MIIILLKAFGDFVKRMAELERERAIGEVGQEEVKVTAIDQEEEEEKIINTKLFTTYKIEK